MSDSVYIAIIVLLLVFGVVFYVRHRIAMSTLRREREAIEIEEHRMFDFLHGLGETLSSENVTDASALHRLIVQGVTIVADAHGGALYLLDKSGERLNPRYRSLAGPPLIGIPEHIEKQARTHPTVLDSYLRLTSIPRDAGILGWCLKSGLPLKIDNLAQETRGGDRYSGIHENVTAMLAPLKYGDKKLGVLTVANGSMGESFTENDFDVFKSVAEQSAFSLGTAIVHKEASDKRLLETELQNARDVQTILLPSGPPALEDYAITATNLPAKVVSGDYFDYIEVDEKHYGVLIADVSGKGIPASLIMAMCRSVTRANAVGNHSPADVLQRVNRQLFPDIRLDMFISMAYLLLDRSSDTVKVARAGHDPPLLYRTSDGGVSAIDPPGMALGIDEGPVFQRTTHDHSVEMKTGDAILLYTDGVNEALDADGEEFGMDRLREGFGEGAKRGSKAIVSGIRTAIGEFAGSQPQIDDITLIAIEKR